MTAYNTKELRESVPEGPPTNKSTSLWTWLVGIETVAIIVLFTMLMRKPSMGEVEQVEKKATLYEQAYHRVIKERDDFIREANECEMQRIADNDNCNNRFMDILNI